MRKFEHGVVALAMLLGVPVIAGAQVVENSFRDFAKCDASFFHTLSQEAATWGALAPIETRGDVSRIKVGDRNNDGANHVTFSTPFTIAGLKVLSYFDRVSDLDKLGLYYYWGFMVEGDINDVIQKLHPLIYQSPQLYWAGDDIYARNEAKVLEGPWKPFPIKSGVPTGLMMTERAFIIEAEDKKNNVTSVSCSLQGGVTGQLLAEVRPDIEPKDYPKQLAPALFEETPIPENVLSALDSARANKVDWTPKFKKLSYTMAWKTPKDGKENRATTELEVRPDGLLLEKDRPIPELELQRLSFAGLVQLKVRGSAGDSRIRLTDVLALSLPQELTPGAILRVESQTGYQSPRAGDTVTKVALGCAVQEVYDAKILFPSIPGKAVRFSCESGIPGGSSSERTFLESLGIMSPVNKPSETERVDSPHLVSFEVQ